MRLIIISGMSGSGKSVALHTLEDLGFYCTDNLPIGLLAEFASQLTEPGHQAREDAAVSIDARSQVDRLPQLEHILEQVRASGIETEVLFLEADDKTLIKRYSETRRRHPLSRDGVPLAEALKRERRLLEPVYACADSRIDTSQLRFQQLRELIRSRVLDRAAQTLSILFESFGYKHGVPNDADFVFDTRCLPNPHWEPQLRSLTGLDEAVVLFLENEPLVTEMFESLQSFLGKWTPRFEADNRSYLTIAIGCTGGQHRSVYLADRLAKHFSRQRSNVLVRHRDLLSWSAS